MDEAFYLERNSTIHRFVQLTYMTLCSTSPVPLQRLESAYRSMNSIIHLHLYDPEIDLGVLAYVCARLPECIFSVEQILFGQSETILNEGGADLGRFSEVYARARRRRYLHDSRKTLVAFIASKSDLDDVIPLLLALQIEWNKAHQLLGSIDIPEEPDAADLARIAVHLRLNESDASRLADVFGSRPGPALRTIQSRPCSFQVRNFEASYCRYRKETEEWWKQIRLSCPDVDTRPVYFISSNTHSLINLISGFAEHHAEEILTFADRQPKLAAYAESCRTGSGERRQNLLYYLLMKYEQAAPRHSGITARRIEWEQRIGISRISSKKTLDVPTQIIDLRILAEKTGSPRIAALTRTDALILNIDYPLGRTAYFILNKIAEHAVKILGVYIIGKAASLFAARGDVLIPSSISDQHTRNQYHFDNALQARDITPFLTTARSAIYDNQRAVTVLGTMLQNQEMLNSLLLSGITDLEMEAGPYLAAVYEILHPKRYPEKETITIPSGEMDIGIVHYVSDNPLSKNLLDSGLEIDGIDATYSCTRAVLQKVLGKEANIHG